MLLLLDKILFRGLFLLKVNVLTDMHLGLHLHDLNFLPIGQIIIVFLFVFIFKY